jgi:5-methylcytosine-specific restriction endonuclease McrA
MRFELDHLASYDDAALLAELRRVAAIVKTPKLSITQFSAVAKVHGSTLQKRFGGWRKALKAAGLSARIDGSNVALTRDEVLQSIVSTARKLRKDVLTISEFEAHSGITVNPVRRLFGSWKAALKAAGLEQSQLGRRYSDEECFENMLAVWTHYGRPPQHNEMNRPPSIVGSKAYVRRWGTWRKALSAFVERVNSDSPGPTSSSSSRSIGSAKSRVVEPRNRGPRDVTLALRYYILKRDGFRCVGCGASPAISPGVVLNVDHIQAWARGGATVADNLRTLCQVCNLGKGVQPA